MSVNVEIDTNVDFGNVDKIIKTVLLRNFIKDIAEYAEGSFRRHVPLGDSLRTFESIDSKIERTPFGWKANIGVGPIEPVGEESPHYPLFVHEGTGLFGDRASLIYPRSANRMVFDLEKSFGTVRVYAAYTRGQISQPYLTEVAGETGNYAFLKKRALASIIDQTITKN